MNESSASPSYPRGVQGVVRPPGLRYYLLKHTTTCEVVYTKYRPCTGWRHKGQIAVPTYSSSSWCKNGRGQRNQGGVGLIQGFCTLSIACQEHAWNSSAPTWLAVDEARTQAIPTPCPCLRRGDVRVSGGQFSYHHPLSTSLLHRFRPCSIRRAYSVSTLVSTIAALKLSSDADFSKCIAIHQRYANLAQLCDIVTWPVLFIYTGGRRYEDGIRAVPGDSVQYTVAVPPI
ncbi:hypothetical protein F5Y09DRAFT_313062 [Xylaria sp. FL1042]|nr:hypothetical protein F5Y09DRAFT_313062 [Xylaria sp. FL1042]